MCDFFQKLFFSLIEKKKRGSGRHVCVWYVEQEATAKGKRYG
jgi:hypothetical protein